MDKPTLGQQIATSGDGMDITRPWVGALSQPADPSALCVPPCHVMILDAESAFHWVGNVGTPAAVAAIPARSICP